MVLPDGGRAAVEVSTFRTVRKRVAGVAGAEEQRSGGNCIRRLSVGLRNVDALKPSVSLLEEGRQKAVGG